MSTLVMPAVFLFAETGILFYSVFVYHTRFFSALSDLVCLLAYSVIFLKQAGIDRQYSFD